MLDLHRGRILREVARLGSMTAAARALSYTQPAVSHHIARLEAATPQAAAVGRQGLVVAARARRSPRRRSRRTPST